MNFEDFKKVARAGDLIAVSHQEWHTLSDIESQIVRMATESEYSHVAVVWKDVNDEPYVIEAVVPQVSVSPLTKYLANGFYHIATPDKPMTKAEEDYGVSKVGQEYSKLEAIAGYLDLLPIGGDEFWECSELTICMRRLSGLELGQSATPAAVVQQALNKGYTIAFVKD